MHSELEKVVKEEIKQKLVSIGVIRKKTKSFTPMETDISQNNLIPLTDNSTIDKDL